MKLPVKIPGDDAWRLAGPPEWEGPTCDRCGAGGEIRVSTESPGLPTFTCREHCDEPGDPDFDGLPTAEEYYRDQADLRADYLHDQARDRDREDSQP